MIDEITALIHEIERLRDKMHAKKRAAWAPGDEPKGDEK